MSERSGSNKRQAEHVVSFRLHDDKVKILDQRAQRLGFKNANELAKYRLLSELEAELAEVGGASGPLATAS
ncbi:hypothetical protein [Mycobacterium intracellulare]|uniref:hypothetical protein n=1 Tax=Mycobacterium intracellulare TaxID=1767 RepID=UPI001EED70A6|nr:hypothetical protein [Mycobacterium intracellulare]MEE3755229.1 hypothetical protein [Mycobacterium intracellulare]